MMAHHGGTPVEANELLEPGACPKFLQFEGRGKNFFVEGSARLKAIDSAPEITTLRMKKYALFGALISVTCMRS